MEKTIGGNTIADFRSGCNKINTKGKPTARANLPRTFERLLHRPDLRPDEDAGRDQEHGDLGRLRRLELENPQVDPALGPELGVADAWDEHGEQRHEAGQVKPVGRAQPEAVIDERHRHVNDRPDGQPQQLHGPGIAVRRILGAVNEAHPEHAQSEQGHGRHHIPPRAGGGFEDAEKFGGAAIHEAPR